MSRSRQSLEIPIEVLEELPLACRTDETWAEHVLEDTDALLNDHAHLEKKAASNALELLHRWPERYVPEKWVRVLCEVAKDETQHLQSVARILESRGHELTRHHRNSYAKALREFVRRGQSTRELLDRLIISALIEARSCERFALLANVTSSKRLAKFYRSLFLSERMHYQVFLELSESFLPKREVQQRWKESLQYEAEVIQAQSPGPRVHSWYT